MMHSPLSKEGFFKSNALCNMSECVYGCAVVLCMDMWSSVSLRIFTQRELSHQVAVDALVQPCTSGSQLYPIGQQCFMSLQHTAYKKRKTSIKCLHTSVKIAISRNDFTSWKKYTSLNKINKKQIIKIYISVNSKK